MITKWPNSNNRSSSLKCKHEVVDSEGNIITTYNPSESPLNDNSAEKKSSSPKNKLFSWIKIAFEDDNVLGNDAKASKEEKEEVVTEEKTETKEESLPRLKQFYTNELLKGNYAIINPLLFDGDIAKLIWIFSDNPALKDWCQKKADINFLKKLPVEILVVLED